MWIRGSKTPFELKNGFAILSWEVAVGPEGSSMVLGAVWAVTITMLAVTFSIRAVTSSIWAVASSMSDVTASAHNA